MTDSSKSNKNTSPEAKKPISQGIISFTQGKANTLRVLVDKGIQHHTLTILHDEIALLKQHYKSTGTDCSPDQVGINLRAMEKEGFLKITRNGFRKANTYEITLKGQLLCNDLLQNKLQLKKHCPIRSKYIFKNSTCSKERASVLKSNNFKQFKRFNVFGSALSSLQRSLKVTSRGIAGYYCFDDDSLWALLERKDVHKKNLVREQRAFCKEHMRLRGLLPDIDIVYRSWRRIDEENNGIRMPMFCLKETFIDFKHELLKGVKWIFKKGDKQLPFSDIFSKSFKEKKSSAQRKEVTPPMRTDYVPGSVRPKELENDYKNSRNWVVKKTDARSLRGAHA